MLNNLRIRNFRMLEDLEISKLGRVNLIVGKNNSGKSTILEVLRIYAGKANPKLLREILSEHDEFFELRNELSTENKEQNWYGLKHLFIQRNFPIDDNTFISIASGKTSLLVIEYLFYYTEEKFIHDQDGAIMGSNSKLVIVNPSKVSDFDLRIELVPALRITFESGHKTLLDLAGDKRDFNLGYVHERPSIKYSYVSTEFLSQEKLAKLWDQIALTPNQDKVIQALKIIDPEIEGLAFVKDQNGLSDRDINRLAIAKLKNSENPVPLNSMGDGMSRILQLILSVFPAKDGFLLIDEFELGLHYSVQEQVWRIIFELAKDLNIQVFATTHSWDCIESFTKVAVESPEDGILLKVSKSRLTSDNGKVIATVYDEAELQTITASDLEVR
ncbi:MAG: AAA family ATPase [Methylococcales bacterium]